MDPDAALPCLWKSHGYRGRPYRTAWHVAEITRHFHDSALRAPSPDRPGLVRKLGARAFERHYRLDLRAVVAQLNAKAFIRIEFGSFVADYLGDQYVLGPVSIGVRSAVRQALDIKRHDRSWQSLEKTGEPDVGSFLRIRERLQARL